MRFCKKIVSCFLCIAILTSFLCIPASANDGIAGAAQDFFEWSVNWSQGIQDSFWKAIYGDSWMEDETGGWTGADRDELTARYNEYVSSLQTDLGSTTLIDGGIRHYFTPTQAGCSKDSGETVWNFTPNGVNGTIVTANLYSSISAGHTSGCTLTFVYPNGITAPFTCTYKYGEAGSFITSDFYENLAWPNKTGSGEASKGTSIYAANSVYVGNSYVRRLQVNFSGKTIVIANVDYSVWVDIYPMQGVPLPTTQNITINSRPTSIVGDYGIIGDDGTIIKVDGNMIVDESTSTVFNPVTNVTNNYTDYAFDYSDRSYNLTLEDGSTLKVVYGDENITIHEGETVYNVYYLLPDSSEDPGGSGGSGDTPGTDDGSGWAWLQGAWTQMMDKLSQIREAIVGLELSPEINVEVEGEGDEQVTQESWFTDVLSKFSFLSSIHDIYSQLIADVTSDAATAAAVADGEIMLADVTTGHAVTDGRASYTAPELAISFGSSDKYGVDWAGIRPLDLSWYAPYKETVDGILSGILWLSYLFLLIKRAPGIIRGSEMITEDRIKIDAWTSHPSWIRRHGR